MKVLYLANILIRIALGKASILLSILSILPRECVFQGACYILDRKRNEGPEEFKHPL